MDSSDDDPFNPSSLSPAPPKEDEKLDNNVEDLLEQSWFFGQVFSTKPAGLMPRCYSDPSPNFDRTLLADNCSSKNDKVAAANLSRTPSLPPCIGRPQEHKDQTRRSCRKISKLNRQLSDLSLIQKPNEEQAVANVVCKESMFPRQKLMTPQSSAKHKLLRTPSLPSPRLQQVATDQEEEDTDSEISMGRLIREAISNSPEILPPRSHSSKGMSMQRDRSARNLREMGYQNQKEFKKSLSDLEPQEVQGFKDLGFRFNQKYLNPNVVAVLSGLQDKKNSDEAYKVNRACYVRNCATPPIPIWASKNSTQDIKLQLKHWARAVASNTR